MGWIFWDFLCTIHPNIVLDLSLPDSPFLDLLKTLVVVDGRGPLLLLLVALLLSLTSAVAVGGDGSGMCWLYIYFR